MKDARRSSVIFASATATLSKAGKTFNFPTERMTLNPDQRLSKRYDARAAGCGGRELPSCTEEALGEVALYFGASYKKRVRTVPSMAAKSLRMPMPTSTRPMTSVTT